MRLLIATNNRGKVRELARMLAGLPVELVLPDDVGVALEVEETGTTFEANAELKARAFAEASGLPTLADDSGLVVDALDGRPGVHSARYAGPPRSDRRNLQKLLEELRAVPDERRSARFVCVAALAVPTAGPGFAGIEPSGVTFFRGTCEGRIIGEPRGTDGLGTTRCSWRRAEHDVRRAAGGGEGRAEPSGPGHRGLPEAPRRRARDRTGDSC